MIRKCYLFIYSIVLLCFVSLFFSTPILSALPSDAIDPIPSEGEGLVVDCGFPGQNDGDGCKISHLFTLANKILKVIIWFATIGFVLVIVWSGVRMSINVFWGGPEAVTSAAKKHIGWSAFGLILVLSAWLIVKFAFAALGYRYGSPFSVPEPSTTTADP